MQPQRDTRNITELAHSVASKEHAKASRAQSYPRWPSDVASKPYLLNPDVANVRANERSPSGESLHHHLHGLWVPMRGVFTFRLVGPPLSKD